MWYWERQELVSPGRISLFRNNSLRYAAKPFPKKLLLSSKRFANSVFLPQDQQSNEVAALCRTIPSVCLWTKTHSESLTSTSRCTFVLFPLWAEREKELPKTGKNLHVALLSSKYVACSQKSRRNDHVLWSHMVYSRWGLSAGWKRLRRSAADMARLGIQPFNAGRLAHLADSYQSPAAQSQPHPSRVRWATGPCCSSEASLLVNFKGPCQQRYHLENNAINFDAFFFQKLKLVQDRAATKHGLMGNKLKSVEMLDRGVRDFRILLSLHL